MTERYPQPIVDFLRGEPTPEQWTAISWPLEPCVVVAGAGSGKTSVMAARVIYLAMVATGAWPADHEGVMPGNVLCLTFTNKATENLILKMRKALRTLDLDEGEEPEISNYHAFAAQVLERHGMLIGLEPGQRVLSQAQRAQIAARVLDRMTFETLHTRWQPAIVGYILGSRRAAPEPPRRARDRDRARRGQARRARQGEVGGAARRRARSGSRSPGRFACSATSRRSSA